MPVNQYDIKNAEDRKRLPKWAQQQVDCLLQESDSLRRQRDALLGQAPPDSDTFVAGWHTEPNRPLGRHVTINFGVKTFTYANGEEGSRHLLDARWDAKNQELVLSSYSGTLQVIPWATNMIRVRLLDR